MPGRPVRRARGGPAVLVSRPPFQLGNEVRLRHGVHSERRLERLVAPLVAGLLADQPDLGRFPEAVHAWARAEARCLLFSEYLAEHPPWSDDGQKVASWVHRVEAQAARMRERLGLDPRSEAEIVKERASATVAGFDLDAVIARGREVIDARDLDDGNGGA
jgi:hypothetical protein